MKRRLINRLRAWIAGWRILILAAWQLLPSLLLLVLTALPALLLLGSAFLACGPTYPSTCEVVRLAPKTERVIRCTCKPYRIRIDKPNRRVDQWCGEEAMPIIVRGEVIE